MKLRIPICVVLAAIVALAQWKTTPLTGTWRASEIQTTGPNARTNGSPQPGLYIFTGGHYSIVAVSSQAPRPDVGNRPQDDPNLTVAQLLAAWGPFAAHSGTYEISGDSVTLRPVVAKNAGIMTRHEFIVFSFKLEGGKLSLTPLRDSNGPLAGAPTTTLTRIE